MTHSEKQTILNTPIGNFWIEADGVKIPFEVENEEDYVNHFEFEASNHQKIDYAKHLHPIFEIPANEIIVKLALCHDLNTEEWLYDDCDSDEYHNQYEFLNNRRVLKPCFFI